MARMEGSFTDLRSTREVLDLLNDGGESVLWEGGLLVFRDLADPARGETVAIVHPGTRVLPKDVQAPSIEMSKPPVPGVRAH